MFGSTKVKGWHCESKGLALRNINKSHPRRPLRASAPVDTSICVGQYEHPHRSLRASASVDTSIRVGRYEHPRRSMRMTKVGSMKRKRDGVNEGKERCVPPFLRSPPDQTRTQSVSICEYNLMFFLKKTLVKQEKTSLKNLLQLFIVRNFTL